MKRKTANFRTRRQRFLMNTFTEEAASPITVILNWQPKH